MLAPILFRAAAFSWIAAGVILAQPIKAGSDLIYPTNPPQNVDSETSLDNALQRKSVQSALAQTTVGPAIYPQEFKIEKLDVHPPDKGNTTATLTVAYIQDHPVEAEDVRILSLFYDKAKDGTVQLTKGATSWQWNSQPVKWPSQGTEEATLTRPPSPDPDASYEGVVVGVYYRDRLQDIRSVPETLASQFPLPERSWSRKIIPIERDSAKVFVRCYRSIFQADLAAQAKNPDKARELLDQAIAALTELRQNHSDWEPAIAQHLLDKARQQREELK